MSGKRFGLLKYRPESRTESICIAMALVALAVPTVFVFMFLAGLQQAPTPTLALDLGDQVGRLPCMFSNSYST